jgi:hypothetical protein
VSQCERANGASAECCRRGVRAAPVLEERPRLLVRRPRGQEAERLDGPGREGRLQAPAGGQGEVPHGHEPHLQAPAVRPGLPVRLQGRRLGLPDLRVRRPLPRVRST